MRTPRLSRPLPAVRLGYFTEINWPEKAWEYTVPGLGKPESRNRHLRTWTITQCLSRVRHRRNPSKQNCWLRPCETKERQYTAGKIIQRLFSIVPCAYFVRILCTVTDETNNKFSIFITKLQTVHVNSPRLIQFKYLSFCDFDSKFLG